MLHLLNFVLIHTVSKSIRRYMPEAHTHTHHYAMRNASINHRRSPTRNLSGRFLWLMLRWKNIGLCVCGSLCAVMDSGLVEMITQPSIFLAALQGQSADYSSLFRNFIYGMRNTEKKWHHGYGCANQLCSLNEKTAMWSNIMPDSRNCITFEYVLDDDSKWFQPSSHFSSVDLFKLSSDFLVRFICTAI